MENKHHHQPAENTGGSPMNVQQHDQNSAEQADKKIKKNDVTGQTASTLKEMKARLKEVPHTSAATKHDKDQYSKTTREKKGTKK